MSMTSRSNKLGDLHQSTHEHLIGVRHIALVLTAIAHSSIISHKLRTLLYEGGWGLQRRLCT